MPVVTNAVLFNTPEADALVAALQLFPRDNAWNEDISRRPLLANSDAMIAEGRKTFRFDTFGDEAFWGGTLRLHEAIAGAVNGSLGHR